MALTKCDTAYRTYNPTYNWIRDPTKHMGFITCFFVRWIFAIINVTHQSWKLKHASQLAGPLERWMDIIILCLPKKYAHIPPRHPNTWESVLTQKKQKHPKTLSQEVFRCLGHICWCVNIYIYPLGSQDKCKQAHILYIYYVLYICK